MNPDIQVISIEQPNDDVELMRKRAEEEYGGNYTKQEFYGHRNLLYTLGYVDQVPRWLCVMQQREEWFDLGAVGIVRRTWTDYYPKTGIDTQTLGTFGEPTVIQHVNRAKELGIDKLFISNVRKSFVRSSLSKLERMKQITGQDWYCDYNLYNVLPYGDAGSRQYCLWNNTKECFFEKAT